MIFITRSPQIRSNQFQPTALLYCRYQAGNTKPSVLFFSTNNENYDSKPVITGITKLFSCLSLHLPPLRERTDDIPYLTTLYINQMNADLGKQIIGFDSRASLALKAISMGWKSPSAAADCL